MSIEQPSARERLEKQLTECAARAVKIGKLALVKGVLKMVGDPEDGASQAEAIPAQPLYGIDDQRSERQMLSTDVLARCEAAFTAAIEMQMITDKTIVKPSTIHGTQTEYIAISGPRKAKLYLHRPALDAADQAPFPYWFNEETFSNDAQTGLPVLHYRETVVDQLGNLQAREWLAGQHEVIRPLDTYESIPFLEALHSISIHAIAGFTEKAESS